MTGSLQPRPNETGWARLLDAEGRLEAEIAGAQAEARKRVASARAAAASALPDPEALAALAQAQEQADVEWHRSALAGVAQQTDAAVSALTQAPESTIDALAQLALAAVLTGRLPAERP